MPPTFHWTGSTNASFAHHHRSPDGTTRATIQGSPDTIYTLIGFSLVLDINSLIHISYIVHTIYTPRDTTQYHIISIQRNALCHSRVIRGISRPAPVPCPMQTINYLSNVNSTISDNSCAYSVRSFILDVPKLYPIDVIDNRFLSVFPEINFFRMSYLIHLLPTCKYTPGR